MLNIVLDNVCFELGITEEYFGLFNEYFVGLSSNCIEEKYRIIYKGVLDKIINDDSGYKMRNFRNVEYTIVKNQNGTIDYISDNEVYGEHLIRKNSNYEYEVYSLNGLDYNGIKWVIRLVREIMFEKYIEKGFIPIHASGISYKDKGVVFIGNKGSGKSTAMLSCVGNECSILSNDLVFIGFDKEKLVMKGWPWCITIGNELLMETSLRGLVDSKRAKTKFTPKEFCNILNTTWKWEADLKKIVFPKVSVGNKIQVDVKNQNEIVSILDKGGSEYHKVPLLLKMQALECDFMKYYKYFADNVECIFIKGDFWLNRNTFRTEILTAME